MAKTNILVFTKTSSEDEDERRLHQDECLLGPVFSNAALYQTELNLLENISFEG